MSKRSADDEWMDGAEHHKTDDLALPDERYDLEEGSDEEITFEVEGVEPVEEIPEGVVPPSTQPSIETNQTGSGFRDELELETPLIESEEIESQPIVEEEYLGSSSAEYPKFNSSEYRKTVRVKYNLKNYTEGGIDGISSQLDYFYKRLTYPIINNKSKFNQKDRYCVAIRSQTLKNRDLFISPKPIMAFRESEFTEIITKYCQSNEDLILNEMEFRIYVFRCPSGSAPRGASNKRKAPEDEMQQSKRRRSVISVKNKDKSCGYRSIFIGYKYFSEKFYCMPVSNNMAKRFEWQKITGNYSKNDKTQEIGTEAFITEVNNYFHNDCCLSQRECPLESGGECEYAQRFDISKPFGEDDADFRHMDEYLNTINMSLVVVDRGDVSHHLYKSSLQAQHVIYIELLKNERHFNFIKDITAYLKTKYFCRACHVGHWSTNHKCEYNCSVCGRLDNCKGSTSDQVYCDVCNVTFVNQKCFDNHLDNTQRGYGIRCNERKRCDNCLCYYRFDKKKPHVCGQYKCKDCRALYSEGPHYCMMKKLDLEKCRTEDENNKFIVAYDIESRIVKDSQDRDIHKPNLLMCETVCDDCWDKEKKAKKVEICASCGIGQQKFFGDNCIKEFCDYIYNDLAKKAQKDKARVYAFAHNARGYDGHFILEDLFTHRRFSEQPSIVLQGQKILKLSICNVDFLDSLALFMQPLSALPKSFSFQKMVVKGFFPHKFNRVENYGYDDEIPPIEEFDCDFMKSKAAEECRKWHSEFKGKYNFMNELEKYCRNDVTILLMAIQEFRTLFEVVTKLDPITRNFTLASIAMEDFRANVLNEDELGITPINGYGVTRNKSLKADLWLDWLQKSEGRQLIREKKIGPYYCDGFDRESNTIYEFFGCFYHGCPQCNQGKDIHALNLKLNNESLHTKYIKTEDKIEYFKSKGYNLVPIWEHEFDSLLRADQSMREYTSFRRRYYEFLNENGLIQIRDAFFGGRTNNVVFHAICKPGEQIKDFDFTSLYPSVLTKFKYPKGHPKLITEFTDLNIDKYFGFIRCKILPPKNLYLPILPYRSQGKKLLFPLCPLCADSQSNVCEHSENERMITGTWFSEELKLAIKPESGYKIVALYDVLHYEHTSEDVFKKYIKKWLQIKTEASGWPTWCVKPEQRAQFIKDFYEREGISLVPEKIERNEGLRFIAKLMLNSLWGKLGQRRNQPKTTICYNYAHFWNIISDAKNVIKGVIPINDEVFLVSHEFSEEIYDKAGNTNIAIAAMVTGYARICLYNELYKIENSCSGRVLYFDTDSVIFKHREDMGWYIPPTGDYLGDMTDEILKDFGPEAYIEKFASGGPKNYAFSVKTPNGPELVTKIKGLNITSGIKRGLDYDCVEDFATSYRSGIKKQKTVKQLQFRSTKEHGVYTTIFDKTYRSVSEKRVVLPEGPIHTVPYGYIQ